MALDVEQSQGQMGYEFEIKVPYTIPSDNKPVVAEIGYYELPASYTYQSTPKIDKDAFLIAQVTDWEKLNLLEGEANVYFENTFIGKSIMNVTQQNDTLSFSLGRDKRIMIQRTKGNEYTSRKFMGSNQTQSIAWKLSVRNTRPEPVTLTLYDQLPVSRNNNITVTAEEISGGSLDDGVIMRGDNDGFKWVSSIILKNIDVKWENASGVGIYVEKSGTDNQKYRFTVGENATVREWSSSMPETKKHTARVQRSN